MSGGLDYFTHKDSQGVHDLFEGEAESHQSGYLTDLISDRAVDFVGRRKGKKEPFLLSVHYTAPHWPWETRADEAEARRIERIFHFDGGSVATYLTMVRQMDEGIGRIFAISRAPGSSATRSSSSPATTAASASPTRGRSSARRWICSRGVFESRISCAGRRACARAVRRNSRS
jgi:hypothetical protein